MTELHSELSSMFTQLSRFVVRRFDQKTRQAVHVLYAEKLEAITGRDYESRGSLKVQTRMKNQGTNLLTALSFKNVPLTNNHLATPGHRYAVVSEKK